MKKLQTVGYRCSHKQLIKTTVTKKLSNGEDIKIMLTLLIKLIQYNLSPSYLYSNANLKQSINTDIA